ncbi:Sugar kinase, ribokinase family [Halapricum desulfuricans]|uniref:Sugar kinase, ribokinase family n=1 Tax=Halapricum desulfuricans TaxID=2841257 RepID=A0A897NL17_9EURY|nr:sugar kinase [Halapricum desulfuricans]QSG11643.1 Sugar kinase, ribokinase family [Halapricum desulfuricans]
MVELVTVGDTSLRLSPRSNERLETATDVRMHATGTESNVAVAASRFGTDVVWLSKLPDTPLGRRVVSELHEQGIETRVGWSEAGRQGLSFYEPPRDPRDRVRIDDREGAAAATMTPGDLDMELIRSASSVFVGGSTFALSETAAETGEAVLRAGSGGEAASALDLDYRPELWSSGDARDTLTDVFDAVDILFASEDDVRDVLDRSGQARELAPSVAAEWDFRMVVLTRSEHGALVYHDGVIHDRDAIETDTVDETGQHDAFVGAFLAALLDGEEPDEALSNAVATASLARTIPGPLATVDAEEVERLSETFDQRGF